MGRRKKKNKVLVNDTEYLPTSETYKKTLVDALIDLETGKEVKDVKEHKGMKDLYTNVSQWEDCNFPFSKTFKWDRWGLLGVLSDYVLYYVKGDILEIGAGESTIFFNTLAEKYQRKTYHCEYSKSGVVNMKSTKGYFGENSIVFNGKSDDFFKNEKISPIALAFIDGDHNYEIVKEDFWNVFDLLVPEGFIFLHDTLPPDETWTTENKCGTVYKLRIELEKFEDLDVFTFPFSAFNVGLTIVRKRGLEVG